MVQVTLSCRKNDDISECKDTEMTLFGLGDGLILQSSSSVP